MIAGFSRRNLKKKFRENFRLVYFKQYCFFLEILVCRKDRPPLAPPVPVGDGAHCDATRIDYQHQYCKIFPGIQRHRNVGDAHAAGAEPKAEPPRASLNQMISPEQRNHFFRSHSGSPEMPELYLKNPSRFFVLFVPSGLAIPNTPIIGDPKPPFP